MNEKTFSGLSLQERLDTLELKTCRPLPDAKTSIGFAMVRFNESWAEYRSITPTLYAIRDESMGLYCTLGKLRRNYPLTWDLVEAAVEALEQQYAIEGYLLATEAIATNDPTMLFGLQGHYRGERQYGALNLITYAPYETAFVTEFDVSKEAWDDLKFQALSANPLLEKSVRRKF